MLHREGNAGEKFRKKRLILRVKRTMSVSNVLLVEDDQLTQSLLKSYLEKESFKVSVASNGQEMSKLLERRDFALLILDLGLPDEDGLVLIRQVRMVSDIPIVVITSRSQQDVRNLALELGADDYLTKPFDPMELVLRIQNIIKRTQGNVPAEKLSIDWLPIGKGWTLDLNSHVLKNDDGNSANLTGAEFDILVALARSPNKVLSRNQLLDATARFGNEPNDRTVDVLIGRLRRKLDNGDKGSSSIQTVTGYGYMLATS